jgi:hypothetical protein
MNLSKLADPFPDEDIEWRVSHAGRGGKGIYCLVVAYITARAIMKRLDEVVGPENWRNEEPRMIEVGKSGAFAGGISIKIEGEWITKWDVCEPTAVEPAKGGFSGAMKRAGAQWGIGRYLYYLDETFAETSEENQKGSRVWNKAKTKDGVEYYWKAPGLPAWALPKGEEPEVKPAELNQLKKVWQAKFAPDQKNKKELAEGFTRFVTSVVGEFPMADASTWTHDALERCTKRIAETKEPGGVSSDVPFE